MPYATAPDGVRIAHQSAGDGPPLLLLAGQANNHTWWDSVRTDLAAAHRTITLDWRGTGGSGTPDVPYSTRGFAADALAVLDDLGVERADVYGTSMGGRVAQWLAADHPDRVGALVLGCTSPGGEHGIVRSQQVRRSLAQRDRAAAGRALRELMYTPGWLAAHPGLPLHTLGDPDMPAHAKGRHLVASNSHDAWAVLPSITASTLVVHGTEDVFNPVANAPLLAGRIPGARLELVEGARHAYFEEFRTVATPLVLDFFAEHGVDCREPDEPSVRP